MYFDEYNVKNLRCIICTLNVAAVYGLYSTVKGQIGGKVPYELVDNKEGPLITTYEQMLEQKDKFYCDYNLLKTCVAFSDTLVWDVIEFEEGIVVPVLCNTSSLQRSKYSGHSYTPYGTVVEEPCEIVDEINFIQS